MRLRAALVLASSVTLSVVTRANAPGSQCMEPGWIDDLWPKAEAVVFKDTTLEERAVFAELLPGLLEEAARARRPSARWVELAHEVDFLLEGEASEADVFWVLREDPAKRRGAGAYVLRTGPATSDVVQAPHA